MTTARQAHETRPLGARNALCVCRAPPAEDRVAQRLAVGAVGVDDHDNAWRGMKRQRPSARRRDAGGERVAPGVAARACDADRYLADVRSSQRTSSSRGWRDCRAHVKSGP
jgi:hypothetical protein